MIRLEDISLSYGEKVIVENLSFHIPRQSKACLYGPSGGGKTSLLKTLLGFVIPEKGNFFVDGDKAEETSILKIRQKISWLPQNVNLPVHSAEELLLEYFPVQHKDVAIDFLEQFGLCSEFLQKPFTEMSGGQKQRVLLSSILSLQKPILLLDEPTSALDDESVEKIMDTIFNLENITMLSTSHNPRWIERCNVHIRIGE
ncbi:MAG: ABC transporter [Marinilabiliales bacterium]|nr:MAG: ABC transporter [Marinilabiliales bacterium]